MRMPAALRLGACKDRLVPEVISHSFNKVEIPWDSDDAELLFAIREAESLRQAFARRSLFFGGSCTYVGLARRPRPSPGLSQQTLPDDTIASSNPNSKRSDP